MKTGWQVHAYCPMPNHFHLVVETPEPNLGEGMHWFLCTYTVRLNQRQHLCGHVFSGRYKSPSDQDFHAPTIAPMVPTNF